MNTPEVVYPFVDVPGRPVLMTPIERTIFITSLVFSRFHYRRVTVLATEKWLRYIQDDATLSRLVTNFGEIGDKCIAEYPREIFWSTIAKMVACQAHLDLNPDSPLLLMDSDAIIFRPDGVINWMDPDQAFAAGYPEPENWEAYVEGNIRLRPALLHVLSTLSGNPDVGSAILSNQRPAINAGCLYFNNVRLLELYAAGLKEFMSYFKKNCRPRPYFVDPANPTRGVTYFSEVMIADQQLLAHLLILAEISARHIRFFTEFPSNFEYPTTDGSFMHFWKLKGWLNSSASMATIVEQSLLHRLFVLQDRFPHFTTDLYRVAKTVIPVVGQDVSQLV